MLPTEIVFVFLFLLMAGWAGLAFYTRQQGFGLGPTSSGDKVFRCVECDYVYTDDEDVERSLCPECGRMNRPVQF
jgi:rubrerythrin